MKQAIAAGLDEITVLVVETTNDKGAMRSMIENIARELLDPVDQWHDWGGAGIDGSPDQLLSNVLPAVLDHMGRGDMPKKSEQADMTLNLPKKGAIVIVNNLGQPELPKKAERVQSKLSKSIHIVMYPDRDGKMQSVTLRMPEEKRKGKPGAPIVGGILVLLSSAAASHGAASHEAALHPDVTQKGQDMVGAQPRADQRRHAYGIACALTCRPGRPGRFRHERQCVRVEVVQAPRRPADRQRR